jgi:hypothetical protein
MDADWFAVNVAPFLIIAVFLGALFFPHVVLPLLVLAAIAAMLLSGTP